MDDFIGVGVVLREVGNGVGIVDVDPAQDFLVGPHLVR
jgi:hypothetical protein